MEFIKKFLNSLLPTFKRSRVVTDVLRTREEIEALIPLYKEAAQVFSRGDFKTKEVTDKIAVFSKVVGGREASNPIVHIYKHLPVISENLRRVSELVDVVLTENVASTGMTYRQAVLLRYVDGAFLAAKYIRLFLLLTTAFESAQYKENSIDPNESIPKADRDWLEKNCLDFSRAYLAVTGEPSQTTQKIEDVPDIDISSSNTSFVASAHGNKVDPFRMGFIATNANPIYFVRMAIAEWEHKRYQASKNEVALLELRLMQMRKLQQKQPDARLEQQIVYMENRVQKLHAEISDVERNYG